MRRMGLRRFALSPQFRFVSLGAVLLHTVECHQIGLYLSCLLSMQPQVGVKNRIEPD